MGKLYLIRHGETDSNKGHRFQGRLDMPLNNKGLEQARKLARFMENVHLDAIYSSTMLRATMTAAELAVSKNLPFYTTDLLQEVSFGEWEGKEFSEISRRWPKEMEAFLTKPGHWYPPNGETFNNVEERCKRAFELIFSEQGHDKNIVIISHGGIIRVQLCMVLGMELDNLWRLAVHNVSVSTIDDWEGNLMVEAINIHHFL